MGPRLTKPMTPDRRYEDIQTRRATEDLLRERSVTLIANSWTLRQHSNELIQAARELLSSQDQD